MYPLFLVDTPTPTYKVISGIWDLYVGLFIHAVLPPIKNGGGGGFHISVLYLHSPVCGALTSDSALYAGRYIHLLQSLKKAFL